MSLKCKCGCGKDGKWLMSGQDYDGRIFTAEPACESAARYCEESASELGLPFGMTKLEDDK